MGKRRKGRVFALQMLYQSEVGKDSPENVILDFKQKYKKENEALEFASMLVKGTFENKDRIDNLLKQKAEHWTLERMNAIDRNILRFAVFELIFCEDIPYNVSINEAIEIAKKYGTDESGKFVNGILDKIKKEHEGK